MDRLTEYAAAFLAWLGDWLQSFSLDPEILLWAGAALVVVWIVSGLVFKISDLLVHLLLLAGVALLAVWATTAFF